MFPREVWKENSRIVDKIFRANFSSCSHPAGLESINFIKEGCSNYRCLSAVYPRVYIEKTSQKKIYDERQISNSNLRFFFKFNPLSSKPVDARDGIKGEIEHFSNSLAVVI